jgi:chitinase
LKLDLVGNPSLVSSNPARGGLRDGYLVLDDVACRRRSPRTCHDVITGRWAPGADDRSAGRLPGYGLLTNIINGGEERGKGQPSDKENDRVGFYTRYCEMLGVAEGGNLSCQNQKSYG